MEQGEKRREDRRQNQGKTDIPDPFNKDIYQVHHDHAAQYTAEQTERHGDGYSQIGNDVNGIDIMLQPPRLVFGKPERMDEQEGTQSESQACAEVCHCRAKTEHFDKHAAADVCRRSQCIRPHQTAVLFRHFVCTLIEESNKPFEEHLKPGRNRLPMANDRKADDECRQKQRNDDHEPGEHAVVNDEPSPFDDMGFRIREYFVAQFRKVDGEQLR